MLDSYKTFPAPTLTFLIFATENENRLELFSPTTTVKLKHYVKFHFYKLEAFSSLKASNFVYVIRFLKISPSNISVF